MTVTIIRYLTITLGISFVAAAAGCSAEPGENVDGTSAAVIQVIPNTSAPYVFSNTKISATGGVPDIMVCPGNKVLVGLETFNWALCASSQSTSQTNCKVAPINPATGAARCPDQKWAAGFKADGSLYCCGGDSVGDYATNGINNVTSCGSNPDTQCPRTNVAWDSFRNPQYSYLYEMAHCPRTNDGIVSFEPRRMQFACSH